MKNKKLMSISSCKTASSVAVAFAFSFFFAGCNADSINNAGDSVKEDVEASSLQHSFASAQCGTGAMKLLGVSSRTEYKFSGNSVVKTTLVFSDPNCQEIAATIVYKGDFEKKDAVAPSVNQIDITYKSVLVEANNAAGQNVLNTVKFCDRSDWPVNQPVDMNSAARDSFCPLDAMPKVSYDIYSVESNSLYLGIGTDKDTPATRPSQLDRANPYAQI